MRFILILPFLLVFSGCASRDVMIQGERGSAIIESQRYENIGPEIEVISEGRGFMAKKVVRVVLVKEQIINGLLKLNIGFQSRSSTARDYQYMVAFFDKDGFPLTEFNVGWLPVSVNPRAVTYEQVVARTDKAETYKIHVRPLTRYVE